MEQLPPVENDEQFVSAKKKEGFQERKTEFQSMNFEAFTQNASFHGVKYIFERKSFRIRR